jgi:trimeric autotransporter adhesin
VNASKTYRVPGRAQRFLFLPAVLLLLIPVLKAQEPSIRYSVHGLVKAGDSPVPGATVTATEKQTGQKAVTWTRVDGTYVLPLSAPGDYTVEVQMTAFAPVQRSVSLTNTGGTALLDMEMSLLSRMQGAARGERTQVVANRGFQNLVLQQGDLNGAATDNGNQVTLPGMPVPGIAPNVATESVAVTGGNENPSFAGMSTDEMQQRMQEARERGQFGGGAPGGGPGGFGPGGQGGPPGGGFGPGGGGGGRVFFGGRGRFDINRPHGTLYYTAGDSALDAAPYSLTGQPVNKPGYLQNRFGGALGGPLSIPGLFKGGNKTFFFVHYNGTRNENPYDAFSTVPTPDERAGNFSNTVFQKGPNAGQPVQIFDPATGNPFANNTLTQIDPAAQQLLSFIPLPNLPGAVQNFHFLTSVNNSSNDLNIRVNRTLGQTGAGRGRRRGPRNNLSFGFHYHTADNVLTSPFPSVGGNTSVRSFDIPIGYVRSFGKLTNNLRFDFNRNRISTRNLYAFAVNVAGDVGINGVSQNPFDWGLPNLSFTNFGSINDTTPLLRRDQTVSISDSMIWNHGKHTWRWGGDFRRIQHNTETDSNARGSFIFTGINTAQVVGGAQVPGTGFDLADFLLGLPQQTSLQFGANNYHFRGNSWDLFVQDEWRVRSNLTLNLGLRYEYVSPFVEIDNRIVNLDVPLDFTAATPVLPGHTGPFTGRFPQALLKPDRNNFAPRVGLAWKVLPKTVFRAGYGINYNTGAYNTIVQQLAFQPPFSVTQTNVQSPSTVLTLQNGFPAVSFDSVTNNYGVDPNYRLGYVQIWNADVQQEITPGVVLNLDYTGTKGTHLDVVEAPNRTATGLRIPGVQAFLWQSSISDSTAHAGTVRLRKRLQHGLSIGGSYTFSKSIDNASSIGGGATVVAQDAFDLTAERGLSSFDQRHRFTADYVLELPFGRDRHWLGQAGMLQKLFGDWQWSGNWTIASGTPFTPRVLGAFTDVSRGTNGTLRADVTGLPVGLNDPNVAEWFNTTAFAVPPAGQFGDARRNSIEGPSTILFNMALTKVIQLKDVRALEFRVQGANIFNTPQFVSIDTIVNSPTFGQVVNVGPMRTIQLNARFRF